MSNSDPKTRSKPGPWLPAPESSPLPPSSWAKRTGFRPKFSGETNASDSGQISLPPKPSEQSDNQPDLEAGRARPAPTTTTTTNTKPSPAAVNGTETAVPTENKDQTVKRRRDSDGGGASKKESGHGPNGQGPAAPTEGTRRAARNEEVVDVLPQTVEDNGFVGRHSHMKYELRDTPGLVPIGLYGFQHYLSILGSLILIPLVIVPAMGGSYEDTSMVVSTVLFISGVTTLLHTSFGSRLPLIQGPSFVYLAPALAIINSSEFQGLSGNNFKHIMKRLQGAIIIASAFQAFLGYSGLMSVFLRLINPVVVAPTVAAVGLSFYSYGFPLVGNCLEIGVVQILLVIIFSLYLRKISVFGHRVFLIYAVPLGLAITWAAAFLLTEAGAYSYKGFLIPYNGVLLSSSGKWPLLCVRCPLSHLWIRPPTQGVLSRGIGLEGLSSVLAGLWGTGTGSTTLTENVHTIAVTKMGSRRAVELGACVLILLSLVGKVGGFIASIPEVMVAALLCFMWAMLTALGLSNLRYSEAGSSRNIIIVGLSLFFSLSVPAYFQQYGISPNGNLSVPSYFQPYIVASHGPFRSKYGGNFVTNFGKCVGFAVELPFKHVIILHMVIAFLVAVILDNTVPGSQQERGVYEWSDTEAARREPAVTKDYELPFRVGRVFRWVKWVGL
ncbi:hypothetical protein GH714_015627 [Hevea brasiliensis]|uniref:Nucleobase-ascorbate transporter 12 n=1 Tax=Hevea brasiliensis TaxID=3981 RepID=A0A6A6LJY6_HEVBR|nr:hypothetical protein GH714_015627 [Hevea brasiliensis]